MRPEVDDVRRIGDGGIDGIDGVTLQPELVAQPARLATPNLLDR